MKLLFIIALGIAFIFLLAALRLFFIDSVFAVAASVNLALFALIGGATWWCINKINVRRPIWLFVISLGISFGLHIFGSFSRFGEHHSTRLIQLSAIAANVERSICLDRISPSLSDSTGLRITIDHDDQGQLRAIHGSWRIDGGTPELVSAIAWPVWRSAELVFPSSIQSAILKITLPNTTLIAKQAVACKK